jgi:hypothetical protein
MTNLEGAFHKVDWALLAQQKLTLLRTINLVALNGSDMANNLTGILNLLDAVQDAAEKDGFPVVFLTADDDE